MSLEIDAINVPLYLEALANGDLTRTQRAGFEDHLAALIAELRASRKVVAAGKRLRDVYSGTVFLTEEENQWDAALAELSSINVKGDSE